MAAPPKLFFIGLRFNSVKVVIKVSNLNHAFWSLSIELRFEHIVVVEMCKKDTKVLTCSLFRTYSDGPSKTQWTSLLW